MAALFTQARKDRTVQPCTGVLLCTLYDRSAKVYVVRHEGCLVECQRPGEIMKPFMLLDSTGREDNAQ